MNPFNFLSPQVKGAINQASGLVKSIFGKKDTPKAIPNAPMTPYQPPVSTPVVSQKTQPVKQTTQPVATSRPVAQAPVNTTLDLQKQMKTSNSFNVTPPQTSPAAAVSPDNTTSALKQARKQLEEQFLGSLQPSSQTQDLAKLRNQIADTQIKQKKEFKEFQKQSEGMSTAVYNAEEQKFRQTQNEELANLAIRESAMVSGLQLTQDEQKLIKDNLKTAMELTNGDMVGGLQTDQVTGDVYAYFKDPSTGQLSQQTVGKTNVKQDYDIRTVGGRVVALDSEGNIVKDIGASGSASTGVTQQLAQMPDFNQFLAEREQQLQMNLTPQGREELKKEYAQQYTSVINQTLANKFSKSEIGKLSAAGLIGADLNSQIDFLYGKGGDDDLMAALENWGTTE